MYVAACPEVDSKPGKTIEEAAKNLNISGEIVIKVLATVWFMVSTSGSMSGLEVTTDKIRSY